MRRTKFINVKSIVSILMIAMLSLSLLGSFAEPSYAAISRQPQTTQIESLKSSKSYTKEYINVKTPKDSKYIIRVSGKVNPSLKMLCIRIKKHDSSKMYITTFVKPNSKGEFSIKINTKQGNKAVPVVINKKGSVPKASACKSSQPGYLKVGKMTAGTYHMIITGAKTKTAANISKSSWSKGTLGGSEGYIYREALFTIKKGQNNNLKLVKYNSVITNNKNIRNEYEKKSYHIDSYKGSYVRYKDPYMKDFTSLVFKNPKTGQDEPLTKAQVEYIDRITAKVTAGATTKYQKAVKIYEYVSGKVYYDSLALDERENMYSNPYYNLYYLNTKKNSANSNNGKVAVVCQGYASLIVAMARAEGIPARFACGRHIRQTSTIWSDVSAHDLSGISHYWPELYLNGKWMVVDARSAMTNRWSRSSFGSKGTWIKHDFINYAHFDPTDEQLSSSYIYKSILPGARDGKFINRTSEVNKLKNFLNTADNNGITNGKKLNDSYKSGDFTTWGNSNENNFRTDGFGQVSRIVWYSENLTGSLDLSGFKKLNVLSVTSNDITSLNLSGCESLTGIYAGKNDFSTFDSTASSKTKIINLNGCKLNSAKFKHNKKTVTIKSTEGGTFAMTYNADSSPRLKIVASKAKPGYKYKGIYTKNGRLISTYRTYAFNPVQSSYIVKYEQKVTTETTESVPDVEATVPTEPVDPTEPTVTTEPADPTVPAEGENEDPTVTTEATEIE